jgi:hypothetical protein
MVFSSDRTTVGTRWGKGPVRIEPVKATLRLPGSGWTCHALGPDGSIGRAVPIDGETLEISPQYQTMWYLLLR